MEKKKGEEKRWKKKEGKERKDLFKGGSMIIMNLFGVSYHMSGTVA